MSSIIQPKSKNIYVTLLTVIPLFALSQKDTIHPPSEPVVTMAGLTSSITCVGESNALYNADNYALKPICTTYTVDCSVKKRSNPNETLVKPPKTVTNKSKNKNP